jgi:hypothetical protein
MAIVYFNGFEWASLYENILSWTGATISNSLPLSGNYCLRIASGQNIRWQVSELDEFYLQFAFKPEYNVYVSYNDCNIFKWCAGATILGLLSFNPLDQTLSAYKGNRTLLLGTSVTQLLYNQWYYIEMHVLLNATSGEYEMKIDGETQFSFTGSTTFEALKASLFYFYSAYIDVHYANALNYYVDDIIIHDTSSATNNSWPNGAKVVLLFPNGRGSSTEWNKVAHLDNYENVDQYPVLDPDDYVLTNLNHRVDLYTIQDLPTDAFSVAAARVDAWALKNSGSDIMLNLACKIGDVEYFSEDNELGVSYALEQWLLPLNPGTSTNWTVANINDLEAGMRSSIPE